MVHFTVSYVEVVAEFFPDSECVSYGERYDDIVWLKGNQVPKQELDEKLLSLLKDRYKQHIHSEADRMRSEAANRVLGTSYPTMLRVYDQKKVQAEAYVTAVSISGSEEERSVGMFCTEMDDDLVGSLSVRYPLLFREALGTLTPLSVLCYAVLDQFNLSNLNLDPILGDIEAVRRNKIQEYSDATTQEQVRAVSEPVWPQVLLLEEI